MSKDRKEYKELTRVEGYVKPSLKTFVRETAQHENISISKVLERALTKLKHDYK